MAPRGHRHIEAPLCFAPMKRIAPTTVSCSLRAALLAACFTLIAACSSLERMPPTPNVSRDGSGSKALQALPADQQKPEMEILYVTDRSEMGRSERGPEYGYGRATAMAFGTATVSMDPAPSWQDLVRLSGQGKEDPAFELEMSKVEQKGEVVLTPKSLQVVDGKLTKTSGPNY